MRSNICTLSTNKYWFGIKKELVEILDENNIKPSTYSEAKKILILFKASKHYNTFNTSKPIGEILEIILKICENVFMITREETLSRSRKINIVECRQTYCYLARKYAICSVAIIGEKINRDHATVVHSIRKIKNISEFLNDSLNDLVKQAEQEFAGILK